MIRAAIGTFAVMAVTACATIESPSPASAMRSAEIEEPATGAEAPSATTSAYSTHNPYRSRQPEQVPPGTKTMRSSIKALPDAPPAGWQQALLAQHKEWRGTRYRLGGMSKQGVDCSAFVYLTFQERFGINLPRSTHYQSREGQDIARSHLQTGDLVFFHTGRNNHVGIYLGDGNFLHASSRAGVSISSLQDSYWNRTYWKAKRLPLPSSPQLADRN